MGSGSTWDGGELMSGSGGSPRLGGDFLFDFDTTLDIVTQSKARGVSGKTIRFNLEIDIAAPSEPATASSAPPSYQHFSGNNDNGFDDDLGAINKLQQKQQSESKKSTISSKMGALLLPRAHPHPNPIQNQTQSVARPSQPEAGPPSFAAISPRVSSSSVSFRHQHPHHSSTSSNLEPSSSQEDHLDRTQGDVSIEQTCPPVKISVSPVRISREQARRNVNEPPPAFNNYKTILKVLSLFHM